MRGLSFIEKSFIFLLATVFVGVVLHAPISVFFGSILPEYDLLIKAWKEILLLVAAVFGLVIVWQRHQWQLFRQPVIAVSVIYSVLHLLMVPVFFLGWTATIAGLMIDLRYILFFMLVMLMIQLFPRMRRGFLKLFVVGAVIAGGFALLQVTVLPRDALSLIGYGPNTIQPYLTVDENYEYVRINSTFRGPNPLGAYMVIVLALAAAVLLRGNIASYIKGRRWRATLLAIAGIGAVVGLWYSFSRSALGAAVVAVGLVLLLTVGRKLPRWLWIAGFVAGGLVLGGIVVARDTPFVQNVIFHENEGTGGQVSSNEGHIESLIFGTERLLAQPLGAGIGSTGSASLFTDTPIIIENQYLFIAHEVGWLGIILFMIIFVMILQALWRRRADWLALGVFASGVGLALIGILLPVWADDTVSIIWWGLAAIAIASPIGIVKKTAKKRKESHGSLHPKTKGAA